MIRSLAALFAKKTAIVAITGVTVIGGATLALAVEGDPPEEPVVAASADDCTEEEVWDDALQQCVPDPDAIPTCDPGLILDADNNCIPDPDAAPTCDPGLILDADNNCIPDPDAIPTCDPGLILDADNNCIPDPDAAPTCDPGLILDSDGITCVEDPDADVDDQAGEHPENHGKYVSEAAKGGGPCADLENSHYKNHGECVREVAKGDDGKKTAEEPAPTTEMVIEQPAPVDEPAAAVVTEKPAKAKGNAGDNGKGKGGKG